MKSAKVYLTDGTSYVTSINGTDQEIKKYFKVGKVFNVGSGDKDKLVKVKKVEILGD